MKLVFQEEGSDALRAWLASREQRVSSIVSRVEIGRTARRIGAAGGDPASESRAADVLATVALVAISDEIMQTAISVGPTTLRSLDAIHLASAAWASPLEAFVTYDDRLAQAARSAGIRVVQPGRDNAAGGSAQPQVR